MAYIWKPDVYYCPEGEGVNSGDTLIFSFEY